MEGKKKINILFLGGAKRVSLAEKFIIEGEQLNTEVKIFSYELDDNVPISSVGEIIIGLKWKDEKLYEHLLMIIDRYEIDIVLPFVDYATIVCAKLKNLVKSKVFIPVSDLDKCEIFFDKNLANEWCLQNDVNVPSSTVYPLIAKPFFGSASKGILIVNSKQELDALKNREEFLIQEFISGNEYSVDIYVSPISNSIISIVPRIRLETQGGESIKSITTKDTRLIDFTKEVIQKSGLIGPLTLQIIENNETKEFYFMEINPRYGGAVVNSIFAGANSPKYLLNDFCNITNSYDNAWADNFLMIRRFSEIYKICN